MTPKRRNWLTFKSCASPARPGAARLKTKFSSRDSNTGLLSCFLTRRHGAVKQIQKNQYSIWDDSQHCHNYSYQLIFSPFMFILFVLNRFISTCTWKFNLIREWINSWFHGCEKTDHTMLQFTFNLKQFFSKIRPQI